MMPGCMPPDDPDEYKRWTRDRYDLEPLKKEVPKEENDKANMAPCSQVPPSC